MTLDMLVLLLFFLMVNLSIFSLYEDRIISQLTRSGVLSPSETNEENEKQESVTDNTIASDAKILTIEEDGRLGNLLMEIGTLILVGERTNRSVQLLPQVADKVSSIMSHPPVEPI